MSKKQRKSVEKKIVTKTDKVVDEKVFCQDCKTRQCGAKAIRDGRSGYCSTTDSFVNRKHKICDKYRSKKNA